jgi:hypothetical protein
MMRMDDCRDMTRPVPVAMNIANARRRGMAYRRLANGPVRAILA